MADSVFYFSCWVSKFDSRNRKIILLCVHSSKCRNLQSQQTDIQGRETYTKEINEVEKWMKAALA